MAKHLYKNTGQLVRSMMKRDRIRLPIWIGSLTLLTFTVALSFSELFPTKQEQQALAETMKNPAMTAMVGPGYGLENYTAGAMMAHQMLLFTAIAVAIMSILQVTRHTRADEEDGQIEMIRSLPTGRLSPLLAAMLVLFATNIVLAFVIGFGLSAFTIEGMSLEGSLLFGAALGATGLFFTALTAVFAQLSESSRGTIGLSFGVLIFAYLLRAIGDISNETLSWLSPFGWVIGSQVYVNNYWWPIALTVGIALVFALLALYLNATRDLGAGLLPAKPGSAHASTFLQGPFGLLLKLQRTALIAWAIGIFILGASYGSVLGDLESFMEDIDIMGEILAPMKGGSLTEQFVMMILSIMAMLCTIPVLMTTLKLIGEERKKRTEHFLSRAISRTRLMGSALIISILTSFGMLSLAAIGLWSASVVILKDGISFGDIFSGALVYFPALWVMTGLAVLLIGVLPRATGFIWLYLTYSFLVDYLQGLLNLPQWMRDITPYGHIPQYPMEELHVWTLVVLFFIGACLMLIGFIGYNRRDIEG